MSASNLPPLRNLPNWSRVGTLDKARYPRLFPSDSVSNAPRLDSQRQTVKRSMDSDRTRVASLEKDVLFLQQQHKDTLEKLHEEIEELKRENKELHYKWIMEPKQAFQKESRSSSGSYLEQPLQSLHLNGYISSDGTSEPLSQESELKGGTITSLLPLRIHCGLSQPPHAPTLQECEVIIRQLYNANNLQSQELLRVKAILKDIVFNKKKMSAEAYTLTKAYLSDARGEEFERCPKLPFKPLPKKLPPAQASTGERIILPSIKPCLSTSMVERQKKAQAVHKTRFRRAVN